MGMPASAKHGGGWVLVLGVHSHGVGVRCGSTGGLEDSRVARVQSVALLRSGVRRVGGRGVMWRRVCLWLYDEYQSSELHMELLSRNRVLRVPLAGYTLWEYPGTYSTHPIMTKQTRFGT